VGLDGTPVSYDIPPTPQPSLPFRPYLVQFLRDVLHYSDEEIADTDPDEDQRLLNAHYSKKLLEP
jgi:hypothetical protein